MAFPNRVAARNMAAINVLHQKLTSGLQGRIRQKQLDMTAAIFHVNPKADLGSAALDKPGDLSQSVG